MKDKNFIDVYITKLNTLIDKVTEFVEKSNFKIRDYAFMLLPLLVLIDFIILRNNVSVKKHVIGIGLNILLGPLPALLTAILLFIWCVLCIYGFAAAMIGPFYIASLFFKKED